MNRSRGNSPLLKIRDKFFPKLFLRVDCGDGILPFQKNDLVAQALWTRGHYEDIDRAMLRRLLPAFDRFIDVGANIGIYTLLASRYIRDGGQVIAFEPSPIELAKLLKTVEWNHLANVTVENLAVGASNEEVSFFESTTGAGALNRIGKPAKANLAFREVIVSCRRLDDYFQDPAPVMTLMKVDVEGFELPVLQGAADLIQRDMPVIMIEMVDSRSSESSSPMRVWEHLLSLGYDWYAAGAEAEATLQKIESLDGTSRNLLAIHPERRDRLASLVGFA